MPTKRRCARRRSRELLDHALFLVKLAAREGRAQPEFTRGAAWRLWRLEPAWRLLIDGAFARERHWVAKGRIRPLVTSQTATALRRWRQLQKENTTVYYSSTARTPDENPQNSASSTTQH